jgi:uncharacterized protein YlzI (FlbEa/FlbD family)
MENKLVSLTSADKIDHEGATGAEIIVNPEYITHFHKAEKREGNLTHIHFVSGKTILVSNTVDEIMQLIQPSSKVTSPEDLHKVASSFK